MFKVKFKSKFIIFSCLLLYLYFCSNCLIYAQNNEIKSNHYVIPMGNVIQIDAELKTIIVRNKIKDSNLQVGDAILKLDNKDINTYGLFSSILYSLPNDSNVSIVVKRGENIINLTCNKSLLEKVSFNNVISGFATLTYIDLNNHEFGAVGHPINIGNAKKIPIKKGFISTTNNLAIQKSYKDHVGCLNAKRNVTIGKFTKNDTFGIKGNIGSINLSNFKKYKVANLNEVKLGKAQVILQNDSNICEKYDIEIINIEQQRSPSPKTFKIKVTDPNLLSRTGGIVQGMSGTPIIQGNNIIGAVSHAVENDPSLGYGVFIGWMINN